MKLVRILLLILCLIILIAVIAIGSFMFFVDPNKLKPVITEEVMKKTGYNLVIDGNLSWSFYPILGVKVEHMTLSAPSATSPFVDASNVTIATEFSRLIRGQEQLQGDVRIGDLKLASVHATDARINLAWRDHTLYLDPITATLYEGTLEGKANGRELSGTPKWSWESQFSKIQLKPLLRDINGEDSRVKIAGTGDVKIAVATQGKTREQVLSNLSGITQFSLTNGVIEGVDLNYIVHTADAVLSKQPLVQPSNNLTSFDSFTGGLVIKNGVAETNNLLLTSSAFKTEGKGSVNLVYQAVNLQLQIATQNVQTNWEVPVLVTGSLSRPDVRLDTTELRKIVIKEEFDKVRNKVSNEIKEHIPGKTGEFLQKLLGK